MWEFWLEAQAWDAEYNQGHRVHPYLRADATDVNKATKMRNDFAYHALDHNMLNLMNVLYC